MFKKLLILVLLLAFPLTILISDYFSDVALGNGAPSCDQDSDDDGIPDCIDPCPDDPWNTCIYIPWIEWQWEIDLLEGSVIQAREGEVISLDLMLVRAPTGLQEYEFHFQIGDSLGEGHIAEIKRVESIAIEEEFCRSHISPDLEWQGFWINFSCKDRDNQVRSHERNLKMATIELKALRAGRTYLWFRIEAIDDDHIPVVNRILPPFAFKLEILK